MIFNSKKTIFLISVLVSCHSFGGVLEALDESKASSIFVFDQTIFSRSTPNRLICAYKEGDDLSIPFNELTISELIKFKRNNVNLVCYTPEFDTLAPTNSQKNIEIQSQLEWLASYGMCVWADVLEPNLYLAQAKDVDVINDPTSRDAWKNAVASLDETSGRTLFSLARAWDIRLEFLLEKRIIAWGSFFCESSGVCVADNPIFGVWSFESTWLDRMLAGEWRELPEYFQQELFSEWNNWVYNEVVQSTTEFKNKYEFVVDGESVENSTLKLIVIDNDSSESDNWITIPQEQKEDFETSARYSLQREFFVQLYLNHISRIKSRFYELGSVSRDAPYFITMSAKDNAHLQLTDIYFGSAHRPYVSRYLGPDEEYRDGTFSLGMKHFYDNAEFNNASIIMVPMSVFETTTPYNLGIMHAAFSIYPSAIERFNLNQHKISYIEKECVFTFGSSETNIIDGIQFVIRDRSISQYVTNNVNGVEVVSIQEPDNSGFEMTMRYIKIEHTVDDYSINQTYIFLDYDPSLAEFTQFHIFSDKLSNYSLLAEKQDENHTTLEYEFDHRGAIKLSLKPGFMMFFIEEPSNEILIRFE